MCYDIIEHHTFDLRRLSMFLVKAHCLRLCVAWHKAVIHLSLASGRHFLRKYLDLLQV